jgi:hypothetical protein
MYQRDITQNVNPATADPSSMVQAINMRGRAMVDTIGAVGTLYETKKAMDIQQAVVDAEAIQQRFFETNMGAEQASEMLGPMQREIANLEQIGPLSPIEQGVLQNFQEQAARLSYAAAGGMSNAEYDSRVTALTKQTIAKYPGLADKIREAVGAVAGLPGADRFAANRFVATRFGGGREGSDAADGIRRKFLEEELKTVATEHSLSPADVESIYTSNPSAYATLKTQAFERVENRRNVTLAQEELEARAAAGNLKADEIRPQALAIFDGFAFESSVDTATNMARQGLFNNLIEGARAGTVSAEQLEAETTLWRGQMVASLNNAKARAIGSLVDMRSKYGWDDDTHKSLKASIEEKYNAQIALWNAEGGLALMAGAVSKYQNQGYNKIKDAYQLSIDAMRTYGPEVVKQYLLTPQSLKMDQPEVFTEIDKIFRTQVDLRSKLSTNDQRIQDSILYNVRKAEETGAVTISEMPPEEGRAVAAVVTSKAVAALDKAILGDVLSPGEFNSLNAGIQISATGSNPQTLSRLAPSIKSKLKQAPEDVQNNVRAAASKGTVDAFNAINKVLDDIEAKHGVRLQLGVNSAGQLVPLRATAAFATTPGGAAVGGRPVSSTPAAAIDDFNRNAAYLTANLVSASYIAQDLTKQDIATSYADIFNSRGEYTGFFSMEAQPATNSAPRGRLGPAVTGKIIDAPESLDNFVEFSDGRRVQKNPELEAMLEDMAGEPLKDGTPLNMDFLRQSIYRLPVERQNIIVEKLKRGETPTMADIAD